VHHLERVDIEDADAVPPAQRRAPAPASVARVNYSYRYQLTLVCKNSAAIRRLLSYVLAEFSRDRRNKGITALIDVNSYQ